MNQPYPGTQAILRAIHLLKAFSDDRPELNLNEISHAASLKKTTAYRLLTALESEGLVMRGQLSDTYRLGPEIITLAGRALRSFDLRAASRTSLDWLVQQTGETATLEILVDGQVMILDEMHGRHLLGSGTWIGTRWPLHATSTGKVFMAGMPASELGHILVDPLPAWTDFTITTSRRMLAELDVVRRRGYATAKDELEAGYVAVAAPIYQLDMRIAAALSIGGPGVRLQDERLHEIASLLKEQAQVIAYGLGYRPISTEE